MLGFFKKKGEQPEEEQRVQNTENKQFKAFAAQFKPEELPILAVTGANGFGGGKAGKEKLWTASIGLTAWMEEDSPDIHRGEFVLSTIADDKLLGYLQRRARPDSIIKFQGRVSEDGKRLLLLDLPESAFDPDLKAILEEQKKPVTFQEEGLGTFTLDRQVDWFETEVDWLGGQISLVFDAGEDRAGALQNAKALLADAASWDKRVRENNEKENDTTLSFDTEPLDSIVPLDSSSTDKKEADGDLRILFIGNGSLADEKDSDANLANVVQAKTGATVYNCAIPGSYMTMKNDTYKDSFIYDAFSFYIDQDAGSSQVNSDICSSHNSISPFTLFSLCFILFRIVKCYTLFQPVPNVFPYL